MSKPERKLTVVEPVEETKPREMWAIDRPYKKPVHKKPHFPDHSKQPIEISAVKARLNELKPKRQKKVKEQPKLTFWQKLFKYGGL